MRLRRYIALYVFATLVGLGLTLTHASLLEALATVVVLAGAVMAIFSVADRTTRSDHAEGGD